MGAGKYFQLVSKNHPYGGQEYNGRPPCPSRYGFLLNYSIRVILPVRYIGIVPTTTRTSRWCIDRHLPIACCAGLVPVVKRGTRKFTFPL